MAHRGKVRKLTKKNCVHYSSRNVVILKLQLKRVNVEKELDKLRKLSKENSPDKVHLGRVFKHHQTGLSSETDPTQILREAFSFSGNKEKESPEKTPRKKKVFVKEDVVNPLTGLPVSFDVGCDVDEEKEKMEQWATCNYCGLRETKRVMWQHVMTNHKS